MFLSYPLFCLPCVLQSLVRTVGDGGDGNYNLGRYSNPQMDALVERTCKETDLAVRTDLLTKALALQNEDAYIPLHNQIIPWAMKKRRRHPSSGQPRRLAITQRQVIDPHQGSPRFFWCCNSMLAFILRRLAQAVLVMLCVAFVAFMLFQFVGDPVSHMLGQDATAEQIREARMRWGSTIRS